MFSLANRVVIQSLREAILSEYFPFREYESNWSLAVCVLRGRSRERCSTSVPERYFKGSSEDGRPLVPHKQRKTEAPFSIKKCFGWSVHNILQQVGVLSNLVNQSA